MVFDRNQKDSQSLKLFPSNTAAVQRINCLLGAQGSQTGRCPAGKEMSQVWVAHPGEDREKPASSDEGASHERENNASHLPHVSVQPTPDQG